MKKEYWLMSALFLAGIVCANLVGPDCLTTCGVLNDYFLGSLSQTSILHRELMIEILLLRARELVMILFLSAMMKKVPVAKGCVGFLLFSLGFFVTASIFNFGWKGIIVALAALFPQWIFYGLGLCGIVRWGANGYQPGDRFSHYRKDGTKYRVQIVRYGAIAGISLLGVLTESYWNPELLKNLLKIL